MVTKSKMTKEQAKRMFKNFATRYQVIAPTTKHVRLFRPLPTSVSNNAIILFYKVCTVDHLQQYTGRLVKQATEFPSASCAPLTKKDMIALSGLARTQVYEALRVLCQESVMKEFAGGYIVNPLYASTSPMVYAEPEVHEGRTSYKYINGGSGIDQLLYTEFHIKDEDIVDIGADIPILCMPTVERQKLDDEIINDAIAAEKHRQDLAEGVVD